MLPAISQSASGLGGSFNDSAGGAITKTIVDRGARRRLEKTRTTMPASNDAAVSFRSTGTQLKTREIANTIDAGNAQVFTIMSAILTEYEKRARATGHPNDLAPFTVSAPGIAHRQQRRSGQQVVVSHPKRRHRRRIG